MPIYEYEAVDPENNALRPLQKTVRGHPRPSRKRPFRLSPVRCGNQKKNIAVLLSDPRFRRRRGTKRNVRWPITNDRGCSAMRRNSQTK